VASTRVSGGTAFFVTADRDKCPVCSNGLGGGLAYLSFGAVIDLSCLKKTKLNDGIMEGFCNIGYHGVRSDMGDSADYCVADGIKGGQLDIQFCSLACLRKWLGDIVDYLESESVKKTKVGKTKGSFTLGKLRIASSRLKEH
jgi:hypothetical protein